MQHTDIVPMPADMAPLASPVERSVAAPSVRRRELGLDVARALAILGMLLAHFGGSPNGDQDDWATSVVRFTDGRAMPLFVMLSGAGCVYLLRRSQRPVREILGRSAALLVLGLAFEHTTGIAVILQSYALYFVLALLVRRLPDRWLLGLAGVVAAIGAAAHLFLLEHLPHGFEHVGPNASTWGALRLLWQPHVLLSELCFTGLYPVFPTFAFALVGMWIARQDLSSRRLRAGLLLVGLTFAVVGYSAGYATDDERAVPAELTQQLGPVVELVQKADGIGLDLTQGIAFLAINQQQEPSELFAEIAAQQGATVEQVREMFAEIERDPRVVQLTEPSGWELLDAGGHSQLPAWVLGAMGSSMAFLAICLMLADRLPRATLPLARTGQLALTVYVAQLALLRWPMQHWPWGFTTSETVLLTFAGFAATVLVCTLWRRWFAHGPLEAGLRTAGGR